MALEGMNDYLHKRAQQLGLERADQLVAIQRELDRLYPGQCRAASLNSGVLKITTRNASVASELRFRQAGLRQKFPQLKSINIMPM